MNIKFKTDITEAELEYQRLLEQKNSITRLQKYKQQIENFLQVQQQRLKILEIEEKKVLNASKIEIKKTEKLIQTKISANNLKQQLNEMEKIVSANKQAAKEENRQKKLNALQKKQFNDTYESKQNDYYQIKLQTRQNNWCIKRQKQDDLIIKQGQRINSQFKYKMGQLFLEKFWKDREVQMIEHKKHYKQQIKSNISLMGNDLKTVISNQTQLIEKIKSQQQINQEIKEKYNQIYNTPNQYIQQENQVSKKLFPKIKQQSQHEHFYRKYDIKMLDLEKFKQQTQQKRQKKSQSLSSFDTLHPKLNTQQLL